MQKSKKSLNWPKRHGGNMNKFCATALIMPLIFLSACATENFECPTWFTYSKEFSDGLAKDVLEVQYLYQRLVQVTSDYSVVRDQLRNKCAQ